MILLSNKGRKVLQIIISNTMETLTTKQTIGIVIILVASFLAYGFIVGHNELLAIKAGI